MIYFLGYSHGVCHLDDNECNSIKILLVFSVKDLIIA